jgi:hypothetical protein
MFSPKWLAVLALSLSTAVGYAGTLTIRSPIEGAFIGFNSELSFLITGARVDVNVKIRVEGPAGVSEETETYTPDSDGEIDESFRLGFDESSPDGDYKITVSATEPNNTYPTQVVNVKLDKTAPKILELYPVTGSFVRGVVKIRARIQEPNIENWDIKVNGLSIPNNTGTTNTVAVDWNTTGLTADGTNSVVLTVRDRAGNLGSATTSLTVDRVAPVISLVYPTASSRLNPDGAIPVLIDFSDASTNSISFTGLDVVLQRTDGSFLGRVTRVSSRTSGGTTLRWTGRFNYRRGTWPRTFKIVVNGIDRAGNRAVPQELTVTIR